MEFVKEKCGCRPYWAIGDRSKIEYCSLHEVAPDLLEALIEITGYKYDKKTNRISISVLDRDSTVKKAMIAIAKANGEYKL